MMELDCSMTDWTILKVWAIGQGERKLYDMINGDLDLDTYIMEITDRIEWMIELREKELKDLKEGKVQTSDAMETSIEMSLNNARWQLARIREYEDEKKRART